MTSHQRWIRASAVIAAAIVVTAVVAAPADATRRLYTTDFNGNVVGYDVAADGSLTATPGGAFSGGSGLTSEAFTPDGRLLYVANYNADQLYGFAVAVDGSLTQVPGSPYATGTDPISVAVDPGGRRVYETDRGSSQVSGWAIAADGSLTALPGSPYTTSDQPHGIAFSPDGAHAFVAASGANVVDRYSVLADGSLASTGTTPTDVQPVNPAVTPDGRFLFVPNVNSATVSAYAVGAGGSLTELPGSPYPAGRGSIGTAISPRGDSLFVSNLSGRSLSAYAIGADGVLTEAVGSPYSVGDVPFSAAVSPDGKRVYVDAFSEAAIRVFDIGAGATLTPTAYSPVASSQSHDNQSLAFTPDLAPTAAFTSSGSGGTVTFDASSSTDADGTVARYDWDFGDGQTLRDGGAHPTHTYAAAGRYDVTLTVTDDEGCSAPVWSSRMYSCSGSTATRTAVVPVSLGAPTITAQLASADGINAAGWARGPVTVTFACTPSRGATIVGSCGGPLVVKKKQVRGKVVTRSVTDSSGQRATVSVTVRVDQKKPTLRVTGVHPGATYSDIRTVRCVGKDEFSGISSCKVATSMSGAGGVQVVHYLAVATDVAGNVTKRRGSYQVD